MGMPHRGRLNVLANILDKPYAAIFSEFEGNLPERSPARATSSTTSAPRPTTSLPDGKRIHLSLTANPCHLEAVNPVVEGQGPGQADARRGHRAQLGDRRS